jgi:hypothetical protein
LFGTAPAGEGPRYRLDRQSQIIGNKPLGLSATGFYVTKESAARIADPQVEVSDLTRPVHDRPVDVKKLGRELNIRYVLEGSVQRGGNRFRVNVQLIDAETDNHFWAERFDKPVADLFDMQDEIVSRLANTLNAELIAVEGAPRLTFVRCEAICGFR